MTSARGGAVEAMPRGRVVRARIFEPVPVVVTPDMDADARLLASWAGLPDPQIWRGEVLTVRLARRRLLDLRHAQARGAA